MFENVDYAFWGNLNKIKFHAFRVHKIIYPLGQNDVPMTSLSSRIFLTLRKLNLHIPKKVCGQFPVFESKNVFIILDKVTS